MRPFLHSLFRSSVLFFFSPFICPSFRPSVLKPVSPLSFCPSILPSVQPSFSSSVLPPSVLPSVLPSFRPSVCPSLRPSFCPFSLLSFSPSVLQSGRHSVCPSVFVSVHPCCRPTVLEASSQPVILAAASLRIGRLSCRIDSSATGPPGLRDSPSNIYDIQSTVASTDRPTDRWTGSRTGGWATTKAAEQGSACMQMSYRVKRTGCGKVQVFRFG